MLGEHVYVVGNYHEVTDDEPGVHASGGVRYKKCLDAKLAHHAYGECHLLHRVTLIEMETSLHGHYLLVAQLAENEFAGVAFHGREREIWDVLVLYLVLVGNLVHKAAETCTKNDGCLGRRVHPTLEKFCCFLNFL